MRAASSVPLIVALTVTACSGGGTSTPSMPPPSAVPKAGDFDTSFGQGGIASADPVPGRTGAFGAIVADASGKLLVIGSTDFDGRVLQGTSSVLARLLPLGMWDTSLNQTGFIYSPPTTGEARTGLALYPLSDGRILSVEGAEPCSAVACPDAGSPIFDVEARRLSSTGTPDPDYGTAGIAKSLMYPSATLLANDSLFVIGQQTIRQPGMGDTFDQRMDVFGSEGLSDPRWSASARAWTCGPPGRVLGHEIVARLPSGQLLVAHPVASGICLTRFNADGAIDVTYGMGGHSVLTDTRVAGTGDPNDVYALLVEQDGTAVLLVQSVGFGLFPNLLVWITPTGILDATRGTSGVTDMGSDPINVVTGIALQTDGKVLVTGFTATGPPVAPGVPYTTNVDQPRVIRYLGNGKLDMAFGSAGPGYATLVTDDRRIIPGAITQGPDGAIYVAGAVAPFPHTAPGPQSFAVAKLHG